MADQERFEYLQGRDIRDKKAYMWGIQATSDEAQVTEQIERTIETSTRGTKGCNGWKINISLTIVENRVNPEIQRKAEHPNREKDKCDGCGGVRKMKVCGSKAIERREVRVNIDSVPNRRTKLFLASCRRNYLVVEIHARKSGALYSAPVSADYLLHDTRHRTDLGLRVSTTTN